MLFCGDFSQILPVIQGGTRSNIVDSCLKKSFLWDHNYYSSQAFAHKHEGAPPWR